MKFYSKIFLLIISICFISSCNNKSPKLSQSDSQKLKRYESILAKYDTNDPDANPMDMIKILNSELAWQMFEQQVEDYSYNEQRDAYNVEYAKLAISPDIMKMTDAERKTFSESLSYSNGKTLHDLYNFVKSNKQYFSFEDLVRLEKYAKK